MKSLSPQAIKESNFNVQWTRQAVVDKMTDFEGNRGIISQRAWAEEEQIPRTTLRHWLNRIKTMES